MTSTSMPLGRFDPLRLERKLAALDMLSRRLWLPAIINSEGSPFIRLDALARAHQRLLAGSDPLEADDGWPQADILEPFVRACARLRLGQLVRASAELADQVLRNLLWHVDRVALLAGSVGRTQAAASCAQAFFDDWEQRSAEYREVFRVVETLDGIASFARWSEVRGYLRSQQWQQVLDARDRIEQMPKLAALIRSIGRREASEREMVTTVAQDLPSSDRLTWVRKQRPTSLPGAPLETRGVRRSGDFTRMLASESLLLRRRRRLLAAKIAEQTLLAYQHRDIGTAVRWERDRATIKAQALQKRVETERGPMLLCVDTSASMQGAPEQVAKAVVLEAMRAAGAGRRECLVYAFSGPGELSEWSLDSGFDGLRAVGDFLGRSFHGGTDICGPLERIVTECELGRWKDADLLLASDGQFGAPESLLQRFAALRASTGLKVHGVLIGDRETIGMRKLCDQVFWVRDWRRYANHGQKESPVHASDLTHRYFPGAFAPTGSSGAGA
jgi:uncharacterized protein with von Willebrand factor type A (vWA) domain